MAAAADLEHDVPLTPQSVFYMASVSKQFAALSILLLEQDGNLSVEGRVRKYVTELPEHADAITIRQLLNHTSGLRDYLDLTAMSSKFAEVAITEKNMLSVLARQTRLNLALGAEYTYGNSRYALLSIIASLFVNEQRCGLFLRPMAIVGVHSLTAALSDLTMFHPARHRRSTQQESGCSSMAWGQLTRRIGIASRHAGKRSSIPHGS
ncbi:MAG: beta-lactamase family protein [Aeromicrobium sp.]|nr:beta-lactamase family protein [Burkholderiales bacterium]